MKRLLAIGVGCALVVCAAFSAARASEVDILVDKLVKKGVLNKQEATEVLQEVQDAQWQEKDKERAEVIKGTKDAIKKDNPSLFAGEIPAWVRRMEIKGDLRLRYENIDRDVTGYSQRERYRYRLRLGVVTKLDEINNMEIGFGFASGSDDPRSTNQTYGNEFSKGDLRVDYAYAKYKPFSWVTLLAGKFNNPLWLPTDTFWDYDINPEGLAAQFNYAASPNIDLFLNTGWLVLDELPNDENDPSVFVFQPGSKIKFGDAYFKNAVSYMQSNNVKNHNFAAWSAKTNTLHAINEQHPGTLKFDFNCVTLSGELGTKIPFTYLPFAAVFGEWEKNSKAHGGQDTGLVYGVKFGYEKVTNLNEWQFSARYAKLEQNAWLDFLPDSDTWDGRTGVKGPKVQLQYGLFKNVWATATYFNSKMLHAMHLVDGSQEENRVQFDLNWKF